MLVKRINEGERIPHMYGIAWRSYITRQAVCLPLGLNVVAGLVRDCYHGIAQGWKPSAYVTIKDADKRATAAYSEGFTAGVAHCTAAEFRRAYPQPRTDAFGKLEMSDYLGGLLRR